MKPFKNKILWKAFVSLLMLPLAIIFGFLFSVFLSDVMVIGLLIIPFTGLWLYRILCIVGVYIWIITLKSDEEK